MDPSLSEAGSPPSPGPERYSFHQTRPAAPSFAKVNNGSGTTPATPEVRNTRSSGFSGFSEDMPSHFGRTSLSSQGSDLPPETPATFAPSQPDSPDSPVADSVFVPAAAPAKAASPARTSATQSRSRQQQQRTPSPTAGDSPAPRSRSHSRTPSPTASAPISKPAPRSPSPPRPIYKSPPKARVQRATTPPPAQPPRRASTPQTDLPQDQSPTQASVLRQQLESLQGELRGLRDDKKGLTQMLTDARDGLEAAAKKADELSRTNEKLTRSNEQLRGDLAGTEGMAGENTRLREKIKLHAQELAEKDSENEERTRSLREEMDGLRGEVERQKVATQEEMALKEDTLQELYRAREELLVGPEVHKEIHVEREGMKARTDLLRKIHDNFRLADNAIKHLRTARHTDTFHKLRRSTSERYGKDLLAHMESALDLLVGLQGSSTNIIRTYFTPTEKLHCGMSSELFRPLHPSEPQRLDERITTTVVKTVCPPSPMSLVDECIGHPDTDIPEPTLISPGAPARSRSRSRSPGHSTTSTSTSSRARSPHTNHRLFAAAKYSPSARHTRSSPRAPGAAESSPGKIPLDRHSPTSVVQQALGLSPAAPAYSPPRSKAMAGGTRRGEAERDRLTANPYPGMAG